MKTAQQIFRQAYGTSRLNDADRIAEEAGELLAILNELLATYTADGARVNRKLFMARLTVPLSENDDWPRPLTGEVLLRIEAGGDVVNADDDAIAEGTEIIELPLDQRDHEPGRPAVYQLGGAFLTAGRDGDPVDGDLVFICAAETPAELEAPDEDLPALWPETAGNPLLKWDLAIYLAQKDGERENEVTAFTTLRDRAYERFINHCTTASTTEVRDYRTEG